MTELQEVYDGILGTWGLFGIFAAALILASLGSIAGLLTRNVLNILGIVFTVLVTVYFHDHLPLPDAWKEELSILKHRIFR